MREGADRRAVLDGDAGTEHHVGLDGHVLAEFGVGGEKHRLRRQHGHAGVERRRAQPLLQHGFRFRELRFGIDAAHVVLLGLDGHRLQAHLAGDGNRIGQIVFALGIGIADPLEHRQRHGPGQAPSGRRCRSRFCARQRSHRAPRGWRSVRRLASPVVHNRSGRRAGSRARRRLAPCAIAACSAIKFCGRSSGVSANITRMSSAPRAIAWRAASTACAVPRRSACSKICAFGATRSASLATGSCAGPTTTAMSLAPARIAASQHMREQAAVTESHAAPSASASACACPRRPPARSRGMVSGSSIPSGSVSFNVAANRRAPHNRATPRRARVAGFC